MTEAKFIAFEKVRQQGPINTYDINKVILGAKKYGQTLTKEECIDCLMNYDKYFRKYLVKDVWKK
jgi:hypothetical protein